MRILNFKVEAENLQKYLFIGQNERFPSLRFLMELSASSPSLFLIPPLCLSGYGWGPLPFGYRDCVTSSRRKGRGLLTDSNLPATCWGANEWFLASTTVTRSSSRLPFSSVFAARNRHVAAMSFFRWEHASPYVNRRQSIVPVNKRRPTSS
jgi:hypothetical protein